MRRAFLAALACLPLTACPSKPVERDAPAKAAAPGSTAPQSGSAVDAPASSASAVSAGSSTANPSSAIITPTAGASNVTSTNQDKTQVLAAFRAAYRGMLEHNTKALGRLLADQFTLTHMTGLVQSKGEWLKAIDAGQMRYHAAEEQSVVVDVTGDTALVVGKHVVTATIYGGRGTWPLQLTTNYARRGGEWVATRMVASTF